jgi:hypothetical protein
MEALQAGGRGVDDIAARLHIGARSLVVITTTHITVISGILRHNFGVPRLLSKCGTADFEESVRTTVATIDERRFVDLGVDDGVRVVSGKL